MSVRTARRGAAAGPSGMTAEHVSTILDNEADSMLLAEACSLLARGDVPTEIIEAIRVGRLMALQKPDGGVRGIVVGDIVRRLVAKTMAKQVAKQTEKATAPSSTPCPRKQVVSALLNVDSNATIVSIDGVGAYDLVSWNSMLRGLLRMGRGSTGSRHNDGVCVAPGRQATAGSC